MTDEMNRIPMKVTKKESEPGTRSVPIVRGHVEKSAASGSRIGRSHFGKPVQIPGAEVEKVEALDEFASFCQQWSEGQLRSMTRVEIRRSLKKAQQIREMLPTIERALAERAQKPEDAGE